VHRVPLVRDLERVVEPDHALQAEEAVAVLVPRPGRTEAPGSCADFTPSPLVMASVPYANDVATWHGRLPCYSLTRGDGGRVSVGDMGTSW